MTVAEADEITLLLSKRYGPWTKIRREHYADLLDDLPADLTREVVEKWVATQSLYPLPGDIRQGVMELRGKQLSLA